MDCILRYIRSFCIEVLRARVHRVRSKWTTNKFVLDFFFAKLAASPNTFTCPRHYLSDAGNDPEQHNSGGADSGARRHQQCSAGRHQHEVAEHTLGTEPVGEPAARHLRDEVAPEERAQDDSLNLLVPREVALLQTDFKQSTT